MLPSALTRSIEFVRKLAHGSGRTVLTIATIMSLMAAGVYLEWPEETNSTTHGCEFVESGAAERSEAASAELAIAGYRDIRSRRVTGVTLSDGVDPGRVFGNVCEQRWYMARLISALAAAGATEIVIDKFYGASCTKTDPGTIDLTSAIQHAPIPIIVGRATHPPPSVDPNSSCLILSDSLDFGNKIDASGNLTTIPAFSEGITRLDQDLRRIPLEWSCYKSDRAFKAGEAPSTAVSESLSWTAASLADSGLKQEPRMVRLRKARQHPFTSFISLEKWDHADALSVLCSSASKDEVAAHYEDQLNCPLHPLGDVQIKGRIIIVGEDLPEVDRHILFGQNVPGVYLQANYIEALLDDRTMEALSPALNITLFVLWLITLYLTFWLLQPEVALIILLIAFTAAHYSLTQFTFNGYYPHLWVQTFGLTALGIKYIESRGESLAHGVKKKLGHSPSDPE